MLWLSAVCSTGLSESVTCERARPGPGRARSADPLAVAELWKLPVVCSPSRQWLLAMRPVCCPACVHADQPWWLCISSLQPSGCALVRPCRPGGQMARPLVRDALPQSHSRPLWLSTVGAVLPSMCCKPLGSHRLWLPSESVVTPAPPAIAGAPDLPKTRPQPPLRSGWGYTFWSSRTLVLIGRQGAICN